MAKRPAKKRPAKKLPAVKRSPAIANIRVGDFDVLESGSVIVFENQEVGFQFSEEHELSEFRVRFSIDEENKTPRWEGGLEPDGGFFIKVINAEDIMSGASVKPILIGDIKNRKLYFSFFLSKTKNLRNLTYTFYLGEPAP